MEVRSPINSSNLAVKNNHQPNYNVKTKALKIIDDQKPLFSFINFKMQSINIEGEFNNFYKNEEEYIKQISIMLGMGLPLFSNEDLESLDKDKKKRKTIHFHRIKEDKLNIIEKILQAYSFNEKVIDNMIDGGNIYQFEFMNLNGACRAVVHKVKNILYLLFMDINHHIYFNKDLVEKANSLYYDFCPVYEEGRCERMSYLHTCFAFDYLDEDKIKETYEFTYNPLNN